VNLFYGAILTFAGLLVITDFGIQRILAALKCSERETSLVVIPAVAGILLLMAHIMGSESIAGVILVAGLVLIHFLAIYWNKATQKIDSQKFAQRILSGFLFTLPVYAGLRFLLGSALTDFTSGILLFLVLYTLTLFLAISGKGIFGTKSTVLAALLRPILYIPLFVFLSIELHFLLGLRFETSLHPRLIFGFTFGVSILYEIIRARIGSGLAPGTISEKALGWSALFSFLCLTIYNPLADPPWDLFEMANPINAQMRIFQFGEIPLIDFMSSHMLSEQIGGIFYHMIYGFDGSLNFLSYDFFYNLGFWLIAFVWLNRLFGTQWPGLIFLVSFPYLESFLPSYLIFTLLSFFAIHYFIRKPNTLRFLLLGFSFIVLICWRLDTGVAALFGGIIYFGVRIYLETSRPSFKTILKGLAAMLIALGVIVLIAVWLRGGETLLQNFRTAFHYISGHQAHGYTSISSSFDHNFYFFYFFLPILAVTGIAFLIKSLKNISYDGELWRKYAMLSSLFFFLIFLANFPRGLVRHGFIEGYDHYLASSFYLALTLGILGVVRLKSTVHRFILFSLSGFISLIALKYFPLNQNIGALDKFLNQPSILIGDASDISGRITGPDRKKEEQQELVNYLSENLTQDQTFLDFSNAPLLYFYANKEVPSYFCQNLQNSIDDFTQINHLERVDPKRVPIVVYSHIPPLSYDRVDGVPNSLRYYLISEYIFKNYHPVLRMSERSVWLNRELSKDKSLDTLFIREMADQTHDCRLATGLLGEYIRKNEEEFRDLGKASASADSSFDWEIPTEVQSETSVFLDLQIETTKPHNLKLDLMGDKGKIGTISLTVTQNQRAYAVRVSNFYLWHHSKPLSIKISDAEGLAVKEMRFYRDMRYEY
jgi:hypothetical protein